ncbi:MAG TPA: cytochrome P450 [Pirellulales bacterium]|nr:cytochrome P450 [Pirellulales bacterium]
MAIIPYLHESTTVSDENGASTAVCKKAPALKRTNLCPPLLLYKMMYRPLDFLEQAAREHELVRLGWLGVPFYLVTGPELVKQMLSDTKRYQKGSLFKKLEIVLGKGLVTLDGKAWIEGRRRVNQAFARALVSDQQEIVIRHTLELIERLKAQPAAPVNLDLLTSELMVRVAMELLFGASSDDVDVHEFHDAVDVCNDYARYRIWSLVPERWNTARRRRFVRALSMLDSVVERVIERRRRDTQAERSRRSDVLSLLLEAGFEGLELRDHVMTMLMAGHETTAGSVTFLLGLLSRDENVQDELYSEVRELPPGEAPLESLPFSTAVWREALRLYPSVPMLDRQAISDVRLGEYQIEAGANLIWSPYVMHRKYFSQPDEFRPSRFLPGETIEAGTYLPFGEGPRMCIGKTLADMEGITITALLAREFTIEPTESGPLSLRPMITLRPENGFVVRFRSRSRARPAQQPVGEPEPALI